MTQTKSESDQQAQEIRLDIDAPIATVTINRAPKFTGR